MEKWENVEARVQELKNGDAALGSDGACWAKAVFEELERMEARLGQEIRKELLY